MDTWRTADRSIVFTAANNNFYPWEGTFGLNFEEEVSETADEYNYANVLNVSVGTVNDYEEAVMQQGLDTLTANHYEPSQLDTFIEFSMISMGLGGTNGAALADFIASAGTGNSVVDMTLKVTGSNP